MKNKTEKVLTFAREELKNAESGHDFNHALRVLRNVNLISKNKNIDLSVLQAAAITHDLIDEKIFENIDEQKRKLVKFFQNEKFSDEQIKKIIFLIENVSYRKKYRGPKTAELMILQDADRLDAIGAIGIARAFSYGGLRKREFYNPQDNTTTIGHFYEKLLKLKDEMNTQEARKIAEHRHQFMQDFLAEFFDEWNGKK